MSVDGVHGLLAMCWRERAVTCRDHVEADVARSSAPRRRGTVEHPARTTGYPDDCDERRCRPSDDAWRHRDPDPAPAATVVLLYIH